jgi:DNA-binding NarL/FixJ family response regulator
MPILNGIETTVKLIKMNPNNKIIILSIHDSRSFVEKALYCGAKGYLLKESAVDEVIHAVHEVNKGRYYLSSAISKFIVDGFISEIHKRDINENLVHLTEREREVLQLIAEGFTNKEIANNLNLSLNTVHVHRKNIMQKLDIHKHAGLIRYAIKEGIVKL